MINISGFLCFSMDYYKVACLRDDLYQQPRVVPDDVYAQKMEKILCAPPCLGVPPEPSTIAGTVYLGTSSNAENVAMIKAMGINYIFNCAGTTLTNCRRMRNLYTPDTGVLSYEEIRTDDDEDFYIRHYFEQAHAFIDWARGRGGRVLIFCPGVSRSGAIAISYLIRQGMTLLEATKVVKGLRRVALSNYGFIRQLVEYARQLDALDDDVYEEPARKTRAIDKFRYNSAHLPTFL